VIGQRGQGDTNTRRGRQEDIAICGWCDTSNNPSDNPSNVLFPPSVVASGTTGGTTTEGGTGVGGDSGSTDTVDAVVEGDISSSSGLRSVRANKCILGSAVSPGAGQKACMGTCYHILKIKWFIR
jgi:hypothetical protein